MGEIKIEVTGGLPVPGLLSKIEQARKEAGLTINEFCDRVDFSRQHWYNVRNGASALSQEKLRKIEEVLETDFGVEL